jgi:hypothetical protein
VLVGFIPHPTVQVFQRRSGKKTNIAYVVMLLIGVSVIVLLARVNISKSAIDLYTEISIENLQSVELIENAIEGKIGASADSLQTGGLMQLLEQGEELDLMVEQMMEGLLERVDQKGVPIELVTSRDFRNAAREAIFDNGRGKRFLEQAGKYRDELIKLVEEPAYRSEIGFQMAFAGENRVLRWNVVEDENVYEPLIIYYYELTDFARRIAFCRYLAVQDVLDHN